MTTPMHITHIKPDGSDPDHVIDWFIGPDWAMTANRAVQQFKSGQRFYTYEAGRRANVVIGISVLGRAYMRTVPDNTLRNNLGNLPRRRSTLLG